MFVPSIGGISHHWSENTSDEDLVLGAQVFTDGIAEARSPSGEPFGDERLAALVSGLVDDRLPPSEVLRQSVMAVLEHQDGRPGDDATLLMLRWEGPDGSS